MNDQDARSHVMGENARSLGFGLLAGTLAGLPALLRGLAADPAPPPLALLGAIALPALVVAPVVVGLRQARAAGRSLSAEEKAGSLPALLGGSVLLSLAPLTWLGSWLERNTHHRPLGAVTFACAASCVLLGALLLARRLAALHRSPSERLVRLGCFVVAGGLGAYLLVRGAVASAQWSGTWLDVTSLLGWTAAAIWLPPLERRKAMPAPAGPPVEPEAQPEAPSAEPQAEGAPAAPPERTDAPARLGPPAHLGTAHLGTARLWKSAVAAWLSVCVVGVLALVLHGAELTALTPVFTWPFR